MKFVSMNSHYVNYSLNRGDGKNPIFIWIKNLQTTPWNIKRFDQGGAEITDSVYH